MNWDALTLSKISGNVLSSLKIFETSLYDVRYLEIFWDVLKCLEMSEDVFWNILSYPKVYWHVLRCFERSWDVLRCFEISWVQLRRLEIFYVTWWETNSCHAKNLKSFTLRCFLHVVFIFHFDLWNFTQVYFFKWNILIMLFSLHPLFQLYELIL